MSAFRQLVFSGVQPTGNLHLGNYLGAIKNWVALQDKYDCIYCVVDMHALTTNPEPGELRARTVDTAAALLAAGVDPAKSILFNQSRVLQHAELAWVLNCVARMGWLSRMTQFKDKTGKNSEKASVGLFAYPCLMAADILLYRAAYVPVGEDQKQHLELTRDIAARFNADYAAGIAAREKDLAKEGQNPAAGAVKCAFPLPEPLIPPAAQRIMSLRDGTKKMSKSDPSDMSRINLKDDKDTIARKIRKAKTDSAPLPAAAEELEDRPEAKNLLNIYAAVTGRDLPAVIMETAGQEFSAFKPRLIEALIAEIAPINARYQELVKTKAGRDKVNGILKEGAEKAAEKAEATMKNVRHIVGYLRQKQG